MRARRGAEFAKAGVLAAALAALIVPRASAQQATISGRVTSRDGQPLAGATVGVNSTNFGAATNAAGEYTITVGAAATRGQTATLTARALGYKPITREIKITPGLQEQNFQLIPDPLRLDELVVTGVSEATSTKKLTFAIGRVSEDVLNAAPAVTALGALQGKVAGVEVIQSTGLPGSAPQIRLRGATSIAGSQDPLIIVDGTITNYSLADIASEDIERVEVVKGAAGSSLYGSHGANGVVQIFTKRGANLPDGKVQVTSRFEGGRSFITRRPATTEHHPYVLLPNGDFFRRDDGNRVLPSQCSASDNIPGGCPSRTADIQDQVYPTFANAADKLYDPGTLLTQYASLGQRRGRTNFNASFHNTWNEGSVFNVTGFRRQNYRVNVDQVLSDNIDISFNAFYGRSTNEEPSGTGEGGPFFAIAFLEPHVDPTECCNPDGSPYKARIQDRRSNATNPLYELYNVKQDRTRSRFSGSGRLRWRPFPWLSAEGSYNYDQLTSELIYREPLTYYLASGQSVPGGYLRNSLQNRSYNIGGTITGVWRLNQGGEGLLKNIGLTTKVAYVYEDQDDRFLQASATKFIVKDVPEFGGTRPEDQRAFSQDQTVRTRDYFGIATLDFNDKVILDGLLRRDGSSLFGPDSRWATYWRGSLAVRVPQLLGWTSAPEELRIRASYGTAGLRPNFFAQYEVLTPSGGVFIKQQLGNRDLKPARSTEAEIGANVELAGGRLTFEYNYSEKETKDQIILAPLLATTGFNTQWQNTGALKSKSHEVAIAAQLINTRDMALQVNLVGDRVRETITDWTLPDASYGPDDTFSPFYFAKGVRLGTMRGQRWVKTLDELYADPVKKAASGAGQTYDPAKYVVNYDGYLVEKALRGTNSERPIEYVSCVAFDGSGNCTKTTNIHDIGIAAPDFRLGLSSTFAYKRLAITGLLDWSQGGQIYNGTGHWGTQDCADRRCDQFDKPDADRIAEGFYQAGLYNGARANSGFVEDADFLKLREVSVNFTFNREELRKIGLGRLLSELRLGVLGRNLFTWTPYSGLDPEVAPLTEINGEASAFRTRMDWFQYPQFRTFTAFVEIAF
jgi:TonB-linked SusC/RagA family outer membrane protein